MEMITKINRQNSKMKNKLRNWLLLTAAMLSLIAAAIVCFLFTATVQDEARQRLVTVAKFIAGQMENQEVKPAALKKCIESKCFSFIIFTRCRNYLFTPIPDAAFPENYVRFLPQPDDPVIQFNRDGACPEYLNAAIIKDGLLAVIVPLQFKGEPAFCIIGVAKPRVPFRKYAFIVILCLLPLSVLLLYRHRGDAPVPAVCPTPMDTDRKAHSSNEQLLQLGRLSALRQVISGIIHEINQPLCVLKGYLGLLQMIAAQKEEKNEDDEANLKYIDICLQNVDRTSGILDHIRRFVKDGAREHGTVEINPIIHSTIEFFGEQFHKRGIQLITDLPEKSPRINIVGTYLEQAVINLLANARDSFSDTGDRDYNTCSRHVELTLKEGDGKVVLKIEDNGCGMAQEVLEHCAEPFYSASLDNSGIGLSMAKVVVENYGGTMKIGSIKGRGTAITLEFPMPKEITTPGDENAVA